MKIFKCLFPLLVMATFCLPKTSFSAESSESIMNNGGDLMRNGAYSQAINMFRKVMEHDPYNYEAQFNIGLAYLYWGKYQTAVDEFTKALKLNPRSAMAYGNMGVAYEQWGKSRQAMDALYRAVKLDPGNADMQMNLATVFMNLDMMDNAIAQYKEVIRLDGSRADAPLNLAKCLYNKGKYPEAKEYLKRAILIEPINAEAHWELGNIFWKREGNTDEAIKEYTTAIDLEPGAAAYYYNLGQLYEEQKELQLALKTYTSYKAMLNDATEKENAQKKIDQLTRILSGDTLAVAGSAKVDPEREKKLRENQRMQIEKTRGDLKSDEEAGTGAGNGNRINTTNVDVMSDLEGLTSEPSKTIDIREDMKKRAEKKKN